jgi:predicted ribosome quality control (RQC) complex YloA/Tae2 family protein
MPFDGIVTTGITYELSHKLTGGKIEKIYQPEADELILLIHSGRANYKLLISSGSSHARLHLITLSKSNPQNPMAFCMLLRKHIQNGRILSICQKDSERIVECEIESFNEMGFPANKKLIVEIMGKHSNIILIDCASNKIIDSIKRIHSDVNRYRQILPGFQYVYPPQQGKISYFTLNDETLRKLLSVFPEANADQDVPFDRDAASKVLVSSIQGISPIIATVLCAQASSLDHLSILLRGLIKRLLSGEFTPCVYLSTSGTPMDFYCYDYLGMASTFHLLPFNTIQEAAEYFFNHKDSSNKLKQKSHDLIKALGSSLDKLYLKKQKLSLDLQKAQDSEIYRLYGELVTANMYEIRPKSTEANLLNYYDNTMVRILLDPRLSASQNAQSYFKKYGKSKTAILEKTLQLDEASRDITYLESVLTHIENAVSYEDIEEIRQELIDGGYMKKRKNAYKVAKIKPAPYTYTSDEGFRILIGRNNKENDNLTFKIAGNKDIWLHTKDLPGSHVIIVTEGREVPETTIRMAASLAAYYSKGRQSENVPVDYTQVRNVKKPAGAKPGMVIFVNNRTVYVNPFVVS